MLHAMPNPFTKSLFKITPGLRDHHNYRLDTAYTGDYLTRMPDRGLVRLADYKQKLAELESGNSPSDEE